MRALMMDEYQRRHLELLSKIEAALTRIANAMEGTEFTQLEELSAEDIKEIQEDEENE